MKLAEAYEIIELKPEATDSEIKKQYRKLARQFHPDINPGDKVSEEKFKDISIANELLKRRDDIIEVNGKYITKKEYAKIDQTSKTIWK